MPKKVISSLIIQVRQNWRFYPETPSVKCGSTPHIHWRRPWTTRFWNEMVSFCI